MKKNSIAICLLLLFLECASFDNENQIYVNNLLVEDLRNPVGIDIPKPRFSWQITSSLQNITQTAYQVMVADSPEKLNSETGLIWNSQKVESSNSKYLEYGGVNLLSQKDYYWKVKVWTNKGESTSEIATWSMSITKAEEWKATWIGLDSLTNAGDSLLNETRLAARYLRKEFSVEKSVKRARLYITGLGLYECYINGQKVGNDVLKPTLTDYLKRVNYNVYDVKDLLDKKNNTIGVILGNGRFVPVRVPTYEVLQKKIGPFRNFGFPKLLMQLEIEYNNGEKSTIVSDESWKITTSGPIVANNEFDGEEYNANFELNGWDKNGYHDSGWMNARKVSAPAGKLIAQRNPNVIIMEEVKPVSIKEVKPGCYVLDMGQNLVGRLAVKLKGVKDHKIKLKFAETTFADGSINVANLRTARAECIYTPSKNGEFSYEPCFTYYGFRYVEITGLDYQPAINDFIGKVMYDEMETTGSFECSNQILNQIYKNAYWGIRGNYRSGPTDCPQRDERLHWLGDRSNACIGESFLFDNHLVYAKWLQDIEDEQLESGCLSNIAPMYWSFDYSQYKETYFADNVTWPSTYIFVSDMLYEQYGDSRPIKQHYGSMVKWIDYMTSRYLKDGIIEKDAFGDWCVPPESQELIHSKDPNRKTDGAILSTTFFYRITLLMAKFAGICDNPIDKQHFLDKANKIKTAYNEKFLNRETAQYGNNTATANLVSLMQGLVPEGYETKVIQNIADKIEKENGGHICTGLIGTQFLMRGLSTYGKEELAYRIATNITYPSWGYMVKNGATTIWELWNGNTADPEMNSHNHVMLLGDLLIWYNESLAGIKSDNTDVGFKKVIMAPVFYKDLSYVNASHKSPYGMIKSEWHRSGNAILWNISIPCNSSAIVKIPSQSTKKITVNGTRIEQAKDLKVIKYENNLLTLEIGSGSYAIDIH